jgi:hypothetical protein
MKHTLCILILGLAVAVGAIAQATDELRLEGVWRVESLSPEARVEEGEKPVPEHWVEFRAQNSLTWYNLIEGTCTSSQHRYRTTKDRLLVTPSLPGGRSWWNPRVETPSRLRVLQRIEGAEEARAVTVRLSRSVLPAECSRL